MGAFTRAIRNISRRKIRALLVIVALSFSLAIMVSIPAGVVANQESMQSLSQGLNSTIIDTEAQINQSTTLIECSTSSGGMFSPPNMSGFQPGMDRSGFGATRQEFYMNESVVGSIGSIAYVKDVVPFLVKSSSEATQETITTPRGDFTMSRPLYTITGISLNSSLIDEYSILPTNITAGRNLREGDSGVLLMSLNLTEYYGVGVGSEVTVNGTSFTVIGIYDQAGQSSIGTRGVYMNLTDAQTVTNEIGNVSRLDVYVDDVSDVDNATSQIQAMYSTEINAREISVSTYADRLANLQTEEARYTELLNSTQSTVAQTQSVATQEIIVSIAATSLIVLFVMLYTVRERTKEIGTLKAIGFSSWSVMSQFMLEGVILSLAAGVVGIGIGTIGAPILSGVLLPAVNPFGSGGNFVQAGGGGFRGATFFGSSTASAVVTPAVMLLALGAAVLLGAVGSLYPAWRASRTRPAEAMRYE